MGADMISEDRLNLQNNLGKTIFLGWAGDKSRALAEALREWLPAIFRVIDPWVSTHDIYKGARWMSELDKVLQNAHLGIFCLTPDNLESRWIHYELGRFSQGLGQKFVCILLFGVDPVVLKYPIAEFQWTTTEKDELRKLIHTINSSLGDYAIAISELDHFFDVCWPFLEGRLKQI